MVWIEGRASRRVTPLQPIHVTPQGHLRSRLLLASARRLSVCVHATDARGILAGEASAQHRGRPASDAASRGKSPSTERLQFLIGTHRSNLLRPHHPTYTLLRYCGAAGRRLKEV
jgi:hypothetical protein